VELEIYEKFINEAYIEAEKAFANDEVPIGAVVVRNGEIVGRGFNKIELEQDPTAHAEIIAIKNASKNLGSWKWLCECDLYVTVEPCVMCLGAIFQSRIKSVVFGAGNSRYGAITDKKYIEIAKTAYMKEPEIIGGICEEKCKNLLQSFFRKIR
jgi:tRNA(adenine34) deaminase